MDRYIILLPLNHNDGSAVPKEVLREALQALYELADGYTVEGHVRGAYRMTSGRKQEDELLKVWVLLAPDKADALRKLVGEFCRRLGQEKIWLERTFGYVELVGPDGPSGDAV
jgi:predicted xylose isomerase-like sugar epimerase